jgi:hypothetical protein
LPYDPVEDIPNIENSELDFSSINPLMYEVITTTRMALKHDGNFKNRMVYERELRSYLRSQLLIASTTHTNIHVLLKFFDKEDFAPSVVDAASLAREQIEKIFSIALVLSNPHKWIRQEIRGTWRHALEAYLLAVDEHGQNPRYEEYLQKHYLDYLKQQQRPPVGNKETFVSDFARRALEHYWKNPAGKNPVWFKRKQALRTYVRDYFEFPTPGKAVTYLKGKTRRRFLYRWHKEYSYFSQFTHISLEKAIIPEMYQSKGYWERKILNENAQRLMERVIFISYTAVASSCTLIVNSTRDSYGARPYLKDFWAQLRETSLFSKAIWNIYPKRIFR